MNIQFLMRLGAGAILLTAEWVPAGPSLSSRELLTLMEASRARYETLQAAIEERTYQVTSDSQEPQIAGGSTCLCRVRPDGTYLEIRARSYMNDLVDHTTRYAIGKNEAQWLRLDHRSGKVTGRITRPKQVIPPVHSPYDAMWGLLSRPWAHLVSRIDTATLDMDEGAFILELPLNDTSPSQWLRLYVDPFRGFVPTATEILYPDQSVVYLREECGDWRNINGLWIPFNYKSAAIAAGYWQEFTVQSMTLNAILPDAEMTFVFPKGTVIDDDLRGIRYKAGPSRPPQQTDVATITSLAPPVAGEEDLAQAAALAEAMIAQNGVSGNTITIQPMYVWVCQGQCEYSLRVNGGAANDKSLLDSRFEPDGLVLHAVEDNIAEVGTLKVIVERPAEHTAFADAVLTLEFSGQSVPVHFVAAPLEQ